MSENKCPCCGCPMKETYLGFVCPADNCAFRCSTNSLPRIAAALDVMRIRFEYLNSTSPDKTALVLAYNDAWRRAKEAFNAK